MINTKDISVVVQGAVDSVFTSNVLKSIRKHLPKAEILLSTWEGTDVSSLDYDLAILNKDPGASDMSPWEKNNVKRQIISSLNGIKKAKSKYVLKIRSDIELRSVNFLKYIDKFDSYDKEWHFLKSRIIVPSMVSRDPRIWESPMCPSDWCSFGLKDDMLTLWDTPLPDMEEEGWFLNKEKPHSVNMYYPALIARYNPEQTIWINFVKKFKQVHTDHMFDINPQSIDETLRSFANNLIIISEKQFGIRFLKKDRPGSDRWHVVTYKDFIKIYNKYAGGKKQYCFVDIQRLALLKYILKSNKRLLKKVRDNNESMKSFIINELKYAFPLFSKTIVPFVKLYFKIFKEITPELWWKLNENEKPIFSIVIPTHGRLDLLKETFLNISQLTSSVDDFEVIVSDDSSKMKERNTIKNWLTELHDKYGFNIKYVFSKPDLGQSRNTNQGLNHTRGEWIRILHSDDLISKNLLSFEKDIIIKNNNISAIYHDLIRFNEKELPQQDYNDNPVWVDEKPENIIKNHLHSMCAIPSSLLFKKEVMDAIGKFDPALIRACDWDFWARIVLYSLEKNLGIIHFEKGNIFVRLHSRSNRENVKTKFSNYNEYEVIQDNNIIRIIWPFLAKSDINDIYAYIDRAVLYRKKRLVNEYKELSILNKIRFGKKFYRLLFQETKYYY